MNNENLQYKKLSFEEHKEIGRILKKLSWKLAGYRFNTKKQARSSHAPQARDAIDRARNHLEELMFVENPERTRDELLNVYYGDIK